MQNLSKRIGRNSLLKLVGDGSRLLLAVFFLYVARHYGPKSFGLLSLFYSATIFTSILADLGLNILTTRQIAASKGETAAYARSFFALKLAGLPLWLLAPLAYWLFGSRDGELVALFTLLILAHAARSFLEFFGAIFTGLELIQYESILKLSAHVVMFGLGFVVISKNLPIHWIAAAMLGGYLLAALWGGIWCHQRWGLFPLTFRSQGLSYLYSESLPLILIPVGLSILTKCDALLLGLLGTPPEQIGWYTASAKVSAALAILPALLAAASLPIFSDLHQNDRKRFSWAQSRLFKLCFLAGAASAVALVLASRPLLHVLYGDAYAAARGSLCILAIGLAFSFPSSLVLNALVASGCSWEGAWSSLIACAANVGLNFLLIPFWGILGASAAATIAQGVLSLAALLFMARASRIPRPAPGGSVRPEVGFPG